MLRPLQGLIRPYKAANKPYKALQGSYKISSEACSGAGMNRWLRPHKSKSEVRPYKAANKPYKALQGSYKIGLRCRLTDRPCKAL